MKYEDKIFSLFKNGYLTTEEVNNHNIPRVYLTKLLKEDKIERISRGLYIEKNVLLDEFMILQSKSKNAIYSNMTALYLHGFSNRIPIKYDITINNGYNGSLQKEDNVNLFYTKKELLDLAELKAEDTIFFIADNKAKAENLAGQIRTELGKYCVEHFITYCLSYNFSKSIKSIVSMYLSHLN